MGIEALEPLLGEWEVSVDIPGAEHARGRAVFEWMYGGPILLQRSEAPDPAPNSISLISANDDGEYLQHYFDSRGVVRLYAMTFKRGVWTLTRTAPDFSPLDFSQ